MARILVLEDNAGLRTVMAYNLRQAGHDAVLAERAEEALRLAKATPPDLALIDLLLPDLPGTDVCRQLAAEPSTRDVPFIIVSAKGDEVDRVIGFELGAADYVVKPFSMRELMLRVNAVLRRSQRERGNGTASRVREVGPLRIDEEGHRVWVGERSVDLTLLEFRILTRLTSAPERVLSRTTLLDGIWGIDVSITSRTIDTHIKRLRDKLGTAGAWIQTVRGVGYRFSEQGPSDDDET